MSSRIFQSVIVQMKDASDRCIGMIDSEGSIVACSELSLIGERIGDASSICSKLKDSVAMFNGRTFKPIGSVSTQVEYAVFVNGQDETARMLCIMAAVAVSSAKSYYEEKHDRAAFVKNIITDNILPGDIYIRAKELHFVTDVPRLVLLIRQVDKTDISAMEIMNNMFPDKQHDSVISVSETDIVLVKEISESTTERDITKLAASIEETINSELLIKTVIGIGTVAHHLRELADRYKEAQVAIEVGKVFDNEKTIINYENLGIGRLIYQLPTTLCEMFLSEVFKKSPIDALDQETLYTINKFFENNLNVSETSRKLFVHRNTLVYRLEKIKKLTGLDLREFDHAIVFKVALMVQKYLHSQEK